MNFEEIKYVINNVENGDQLIREVIEREKGLIEKVSELPLKDAYTVIQVIVIARMR